MLHGPLHEIGLIEVLQLLERGARSGRLRVVGPDPSVPRVMAIRRGRIAAVAPDADDAALARALVRRHLALADEDAADGPEAVAPDVRGALRERLARRAVATMLQWTRGRFDFSEDATVEGPLDWSTDALVLDLVRREGIRLDLAETLAEFRAVPAFATSDRLLDGTEPLALDSGDWRLLDAVDGARDVAAIAACLDEPLEEVGERVRRLEAAAILVLHAPPSDIATEARAALEAGQHETAIAALRARLAAAPADAESWRLLGLAEVGAGRFDRAIEAWQGWAEAAPGRRDEAAALIRAADTMLEALRETRD